jgi:hypothetical protein
VETLSVFIADIANAPAKKSLKTSVRNQKTSFLKEPYINGEIYIGDNLRQFTSLKSKKKLLRNH